MSELPKLSQISDNSGKDIYNIIISATDDALKPELVKSLLDSGSNPNYINENKLSTLNYALRKLYFFSYEPNDINTWNQIVILLIDHGAKYPDDMLYNAFKYNNSVIINKLIEKKYIPTADEQFRINTILSDQAQNNSKTEINNLVIGYFAKLSRNLKLKDIRERTQLDPKRLTGDNRPYSAFFMMGHGGESLDIKIVPPGCIIVVKVHSGELNFLDESIVFPYILNHEKIDNFLDPVTNYKDVTTIINSHLNSKTPLAIYREGDEYPDFYYTLLSSWNAELLGYGKDTYLLENSGIVEYPLHGAIVTPTKLFINKSAPGKEAFLDLYNASSLPYRFQLEQIINTIPEPTIENIINFPQIQSLINIRQSDLFQIKGPGVYYNLVCRATRESIRVSDLETHQEILNNSQRALVDSSGHLRKNRTEILRQIGEAEHQRKDLIEKIRKNKSDNISGRIINELYFLEQQNNQPLSKIREFKLRNYLTLKQAYEKKINDILKERNLPEQNRWHTDEEIANNLSIEQQKIKELDDLFAESLRTGLLPENRSKKALLNPQHELNLQEQMRKQRAAHNKALKNSSTNESNLVNTFGQVGLNIPKVPVELAENNTKGFNQRRANAEKQAAAAVAGWKKKGGRTRRHKKNKNKSRGKN